MCFEIEQYEVLNVNDIQGHFYGSGEIVRG